MGKILIGLIFIFFNFNISFSFIISININFLPDFVGYILLYLGIKSFKKEIKEFKDIVPSTIILVVLSTSILIVNLLMININVMVLQALGTTLTLLLIYILYKIIKGIKAIEKIDERNYGSKLLFNTWKIFSIMVLIGCLITFVPEIYKPFLLIVTILVISMMILFVIVFNRTRIMYDSYQ